MNLIAVLFLIVLEASFEGIKDGGNKQLSGIIEFIYRAVITLIILAWIRGLLIFNADVDTYLIMIIGYLLLRFSLFDLIRNKFAGEKWWYIGTTKLFDKIQRWFFNKTKIDYVTFYRFVKPILFFWGAAWLLGWRDGISF